MRGQIGEDTVVISRIVLTAMALCVAMAAGAVSLTDKQRAEIEARIKPVGEVCLQGDSSCAAPAVAAGGGEARTGEEVYNAACLACHATGAGDAPILGDVEAWADRVAKGMDALHESGLKGVPGTGMTAKGGCMNCTDEEVMAAVDFMVEQSQ